MYLLTCIYRSEDNSEVNGVASLSRFTSPRLTSCQRQIERRNLCDEIRLLLETNMLGVVKLCFMLSKP